MTGVGRSYRISLPALAPQVDLGAAAGFDREHRHALAAAHRARLEHHVAVVGKLLREGARSKTRERQPEHETNNATQFQDQPP